MNKLMFKLDRCSKIPIYIQLYRYIKNEIMTGQIEPDLKLPSIRQLSDYLGISRTTIENAYHQLYIEGYIVSKPKAGYFVNAIENNVFKETGYSNKINYDENDTNILKNIQYDFGNENIDEDSFDINIWRKFINKALLSDSSRFLTQGWYQGEYELRKEIAKYAHQSRGVMCSHSQIVVGSGVQSLINILCGIMSHSCKSIAFEDPSFERARHIFRDHKFSIVPINMDNNGINIKLLRDSNAEIVYVSPSHQFPLGTIMSINKRIQLLNWARENETLIIEDDYDSELRYYGRPIPSLQGLSEGTNVIYLGSFSKMLLPSIRISYMVLPKCLMSAYEKLGIKYYQTASKIEQITLSLFMKEGLLEKHIRKARKLYAKKNQILVEAINKIMNNKVKVMGKETGLHVLLEIKSTYSSDTIAHISEKAGVKVIPISNYSIKTANHEYPLILLSYGGILVKHIEPAIKLLNQAWFNK